MTSARGKPYLAIPGKSFKLNLVGPNESGYGYLYMAPAADDNLCKGTSNSMHL